MGHSVRAWEVDKSFQEVSTVVSHRARLRGGKKWQGSGRRRGPSCARLRGFQIPDIPGICDVRNPDNVSPPRAGFLLAGAGAVFGQVAYRLPTDDTKEKPLLPN